MSSCARHCFSLDGFKQHMPNTKETHPPRSCNVWFAPEHAMRAYLCLCVCVKELGLKELHLKELCVKQLCASCRWENCVWKRWAWNSCMWETGSCAQKSCVRFSHTDLPDNFVTYAHTHTQFFFAQNFVAHTHRHTILSHNVFTHSFLTHSFVAHPRFIHNSFAHNFFLHISFVCTIFTVYLVTRRRDGRERTEETVAGWTCTTHREEPYTRMCGRNYLRLFVWT